MHTVDAQHFLDIGAEHVRLPHHLLGGGADIVVAEVVVVHLGDVAEDDRIAVDIDRLIVLGVHFGDEEAVIGRARVVVAHMERVAVPVEVGGDVDKLDAEVTRLERLERLAVPLRHVRLQNVNLIAAARVGIGFEGGEGDERVLDKGVVGGEENRYQFIHAFVCSCSC